MKQVLRKIGAMVGINWQEALIYRGNFVFWIISSTIPFFLMIFLWTNIFNNNEQVIAGFNLNSIIVYYFLVMVIYRFTNVDLEWALEWEIRNGHFNKYLTKPQNPLPFYFVGAITEKILGILISLPFLFLIYSFFLEIKMPNYEALIYFVFSLAISFVIMFFASFLLGIIIFWVEEGTGYFFAKDMFFYFFAGGMLPISFFGEFGKIIEYSPLGFFIHFPTSIFLETIPASEIKYKLVIGMLWLVVLFVFVKLIYKVAVKKYSAIGDA